jgi:hypothetical protein
MVAAFSFFISIVILFQTDVPLKKDGEFECRLNLSFRTKVHDGPIVDYTETVYERQKRQSATPLPYLKINIVFHFLSEGEQRLQVLANGDNIRSKKINAGEAVELDLGFTDDIKDRVTPHDYIIFLSTKDKKVVSRITLFFTEEGDYLVNGIKRGRI